MSGLSANRTLRLGEGFPSFGRVLGRGGRVAINGHGDGAIIPEDQWRAVSCAGLGASGADWFIETLRIGTCWVNHPARDRDVAAEVCCCHCET